ncbi:hypothetical protein BGX23_011636, partial [Mortierella sp. AD031]
MPDKIPSAVHNTIQGGNSIQGANGTGESINSSRSMGSSSTSYSSNNGKRKISSGSPRIKSGGNMGQKFGEFLGISGSLLGSKKCGSDTSIKSGSGMGLISSTSSSSISSITRETTGSGNKAPNTTGTMLFSRKDPSASLPSTKTPNSSLFASIFSPDSRHQQQHQLPHSPSQSMLHSNNNNNNNNNKPPPSPLDHDMSDAHAYPAGQLDGSGRNGSSWDMVDDDKIVNWEMNKIVPTSFYEDEAFALWIRPNHEARTTTSGADVEKAEKEDDQTSSNGRDTYNCPNAGAKKKNRPELEDMEVLEEILDFSIVILMRASASLYPFIASAHLKSIPLNILWRSLQYKERSFRLYNIRTLKEYQDYVMSDIGYTIQAMNEIYDQQERPFGHPDNLGRDTKPRTGVRSPAVILPPGRAVQANNFNNGPRAFSRQVTAVYHINTNNGSSSSTGSSLHIQSPQKQPSIQQQSLLFSSSSMASPFKKHRRHTSVPGGRPTISSMITSIKQSIPSPISLHSAHSNRSSIDGYTHPYYSFYPDGTPFLSGFPAGAPTSYSQTDCPESQFQPQSIAHSFTSSFLSSSSSGGCSSASSNYSGSSHYSFASADGGDRGGGGFLPQSIQTVINSFRHSDIGNGGEGEHSLVPSASSQFTAHPPNLAISPVPLTKQEEKRLQLENQWWVDIMRRKAHLRGWDCRAFMNLYEFSLQNEALSLHEEFKDLYRIIRAIMEVDATATEKSHEVLAMVLAQAQEREKEPFQLRYSPYRTPAPTGNEIREANEEIIRRFEAIYKDEEYKSGATREVYLSSGHDDDMDQDDRVAPLRPVAAIAGRNGHVHEADETRDEMLTVLWVLEKCIRERPDAHQSPTWFRLSSSANAVQAVFQAGGVISCLKELQRKGLRRRDPIQTVHPVTLTGYFKRLLKDCGGLLLKETTALLVELARPATDNGDFWNLEKLSRIDRALLYRVIYLDYNRGRVFLRISRVMEQILESSPKDMELDAFALSKMVQVIELSGVLDLKALRRWNGAWSSIILGY